MYFYACALGRGMWYLWSWFVLALFSSTPVPALELELSLFAGNRRGSIVIVGDAPSIYEVENGRVLNADMEGLILDMLDQAGFDGDDSCYIPCYSKPKTYSLKLDGPTLLEDAKQHLFPFIAEFPRKVVIALGNNAACAVGATEKPEGINSLRSRRLHSEYVAAEVCASIHPHFVLTKPDENVDDFLTDLRFAHRLYVNDFEEQVPMVIEDLNDPDDVFVLLDEAKQFPKIAYDTEATDKEPRKETTVLCSVAYANGKKDASGAYVARFWAGFDRMRARYEEAMLNRFIDSFAEFHSRAGIDFTQIVFNGGYDDWLMEENVDPNLPGSQIDAMFQKWVINKQGFNGQKENVTRYLGYADYEKDVTQSVKDTVARRGKVFYKDDPAYADDWFTLAWLGIEPELASLNKKLGQGYKWPKTVDKKFGAYVIQPLDQLRLYNSYDSTYLWMLEDYFSKQIDADPRLLMSSKFRHMMGRRLMKCEQRGFLMDTELNDEWSEKLRDIAKAAEDKILIEVRKIRPEIKEFNPNSQPQLRLVLFGDPIKVPHVDPGPLYDLYDKRSVDQTLDKFHEGIYSGYTEISQLARAGLYDAGAVEANLRKAFKKAWKGVEPVIKLLPIYANGIYQPQPRAFTKTGEPSCAAQILKNLFEEKEEPLLKLILMRNKAVKLKGTFVDGIRAKLSSEGVLHGKYKTIGTITGRISSVQPNMTNFPAYARGQLIARPGYKFVTWDLSQAEIRVVAAMSGDTELMAAVYSEDFHKTTASMVFGVPLEQVTKTLRQHCKVLNFGLIYGMSAFKLAVTLKIEVEEAEDLMRRYFERFPLLCAWLEEQPVIAGTAPYYVETSFGTRLYTYNMLSTDMKVRSHTERVAKNSPVQGTAGELTFWFMDKQMQIFESENLGVYFVNNTHDSTTYEVPVAYVERVKEVVIQTIETERVPIKPLDSVKFKTDIDVTDRWYGTPDLMKALEADYGTEKQQMPWHLITGTSDDIDEKEEIEEFKEMETAYYAKAA